MLVEEIMVNKRKVYFFSTKSVASEMHKPSTVKTKKHYLELEKIQIGDLNALVTIYA